MKNKIVLSAQSLELIQQYERLYPADNVLSSDVMNDCGAVFASEEQEHTKPEHYIALDKLITWLSDETCVHDASHGTPYLAVILSTHLIHDVYLSLCDDRPSQEEQPTYSVSFYLALGAGAFVAACDGFDAVNTLLNAFFSFPGLIFCSAALFSLMSITFFICFNLERVADAMNMSPWKASVLDLYFLQYADMNAIQKKISLFNLADLSVQELMQLKQLLELLNKRYLMLVKNSPSFLNTSKDTYYSLTQAVALGVVGFFFFSTGFSTGQSVIAALLSLFFAQATGVLPVLLFAFSVALASLCFFWCMDKQELTKSINKLLGFDGEKTAPFYDEVLIEQQQKESSQLSRHIDSALDLRTEIVQLQEQCHHQERIVPSTRHYQNRFFYDQNTDRASEDHDGFIRQRAFSY